MYKIIFRDEYLKEKNGRRLVDKTIDTTDSVLNVVEAWTGKTVKAAKLIRELLRIFSGR